jgi:hypothetical protein
MARVCASDAPLRTIVARNFDLLRQGGTLTEQLEDDIYTWTSLLLPQSTVGAHLRHALDVYKCILTSGDRIDYESRPRDPRVETDRAFAVGEIRGVMQSLWRLVEDRPVFVRMEAEPAWAASTLMRELDAAANHTIHHYALIGVLLRANGIEPPENFGVSPSTIRFRGR